MDAVRPTSRQLLAVIGVAAVFAGCEVSACGGWWDTDCDSMPDADTSSPDTGSEQEHRPHWFLLVRVAETADTDPASDTPGVDIDAVVLDKGGDGPFAADQVIDYRAAGAQQADPTQALGPPEGTCAPGTFVRLGRLHGQESGYLIVAYDNQDKTALRTIENGDTITVHACDDPPAPYSIFVGVEPYATSPHWHPCGTGLSGAAQCVVEGLPLIPVEE